jgi:hypothetical protein
MRLKKVGWGSSAKVAIPTLFGLSASGIKGGTGLWTGRGATKKKRYRRAESRYRQVQLAQKLLPDRILSRGVMGAMAERARSGIVGQSSFELQNRTTSLW